MRNVVALTAKELRSYFVSPIAYVLMAGFLVFSGLLFAYIITQTQEASLRYVFPNMNVTLLLIAPIITMRLLAEEQKSGTIELLLTSPVRDVEVVLGKFAAAVVLLGVMLGATLYYPFLLSLLGQPDWGPVFSGYVGIVLLGAAYIAVGLLTSALTQNQIVAAVLSFTALIVLWLASILSGFLGAEVGGVFSYLALLDHFDNFAKGVIDLKDAVYYLSVVAAALFLTVKVLETRRWK